MRQIGTRTLWVGSAALAALVAFGAGRVTARKNFVNMTLSQKPVPRPAVEGADRPTMVYAHNLMLRKGSHFRVYIRWLRGQMLRTRAEDTPSFDAPDSFVLEIQKGVMMARLADIADFLNHDGSSKAPLRDVSIESDGADLKLHGVVHKIVPLPVSLTGTLLPLPDGRLQFRVKKMSVLKMPLKGIFGALHVTLSDLVPSAHTPGVQVSENDVLFDTRSLLPPPHIHGRISTVTVQKGELRLVYGDAEDDDARLSQWHNFLRLTGGSLDFGRLTMRDVDLTMIDASKEPWFDLDLVNYQAQLVYGTTRMTEKAGVEIYMPDRGSLPPEKTLQGITLEWLRNRNSPVPSDVPLR